MSVSANDNSTKVSVRGFLAKYSVLIAFAAIVVFFAVASPTFLTPANLFNVLVNTVVIFLISFPEGESEAMALVYNERDAWSDIEKESTGLTEAVGTAIENHYSETYRWDRHLLK